MTKIIISFLLLWGLIVGLMLTQERYAGASLPSEDALSRAHSSGVLPPVLQFHKSSENER